MIILRRSQTNPYFNIAAEEFVLKHLQEDCFTLWRNEPAVIVGRHQNTLAEINEAYVKERKIPVVRRLSGGGAVFHDLGNVCFTFVKQQQGEQIADFKVFTRPIIEVLQTMGVEAHFQGRNDLAIDGRKFSGNADCKWKNRILHHGTLLFSSAIADMSPLLKVHPLKFEGKAVKSVPSRITNISEHLQEKIKVEDFIAKIEQYISDSYPGVECRSFTSEEEAEIQRLADEKYSTWEWNYGQSPKSSISKRLRTASAGFIEVYIQLQSGRIENIRFFGDYFFQKDSSELEQALKNCQYTEDEVRKVLSHYDIQEFFAHARSEEILDLILKNE